MSASAVMSASSNAPCRSSLSLLSSASRSAIEVSDLLAPGKRTREEAMATGLGPCNGHLKGLALAAKEWLTGASTKDYPGYDKLIAHVTGDSAERQVQAGSAFIGTPADIVEMVSAYNDTVGGIDSVSLHFTPSNMPVDAAERSLRLFSRDVMPKLATI
jgi:alkanesulfonate monooxygenase SsuD/methylene tetrahydromethanopterin reductase-like flavin-dependent oxidoreductase (luciferase family)